MRKNLKRLAALSSLLAAAGLAGAAMLSPAAQAQSHERNFGNYGKALYGGSDIDAGKDAEAFKVSDEQIVAYFRQMSAEMDQLNPVAPADSPYAVRLARLTEGLDSYDGLTLDIQAYLVDEVYALAMADGTVRVSTRLMDALDDDEVRCVIGHEIGHVKLEHGQGRLKGALARNSSLTVAGSGDQRRVADSKLDELVQRVIYLRHNRAAEAASDDYALGFMAAKGYDREACATAMDKLAALRGNGRIALLQTHPNTTARAERVRMQIQ